MFNNPTSDCNNWLEAYRPFFFKNLSAITSLGDNHLLLGDGDRGMLTEVNLINKTESFEKQYNVNDYADCESICYYNGYLYSVYGNRIYIAEYHIQTQHLRPRVVTSIPDCDRLKGIAVTAEKIYLVTERRQEAGVTILIGDKHSLEFEAIATLSNVGRISDLCYFQDRLFIVDSLRQTVIIFSLEEGKAIAEILTPFENPTGITAVYLEQAKKDVLYVSYSKPSFEVYKPDNDDVRLDLDTSIWDNFIYPLVYRYDRDKKAVFSNGFLVEMYYVRKLHARLEVADNYQTVENLEWKISLPINSDRQQVISVESIGSFPMKIIEKNKESKDKVAVFSIPKIELETERRVFGWKATIQTYNVKYFISEEEVGVIDEEELTNFSQYLKKQPKLNLKKPYVIKAAKKALKSLKGDRRDNILAKAEAIADYIYKRLIYVKNSLNEGTEEVLRSGRASYEEYLNVFLALFKLNKIPIEKCGNYQVPIYQIQPGVRSAFLSQDCERTWLQFYLPNLGWVPLDFSVSDRITFEEKLERQSFMALTWDRIEFDLENYLENVFEVGVDEPFFLSCDRLSIKEIKFKVLGDLDPS
jgi:hypothetical protein